MSQPDFQAMSRKELHTYVLTHRDDKDAFYAYVDKLHAEATWIEMPALQSVEDLENYPEFLESLRKSAESRDNAV
ncbi:DUF6887 family protein [Stenomitos frigidus]|uniref:Uncharacterized protein n=1 Tax=Stenomitos frigidus ULC18 TaxID=2107698 RepID=A0A2T1E1H4_9CYAN|nr:hypothetical protein [Stenomitos frigidus]PSB26598.1 hypothetical protein C7B82_19445 [Stenomitos frigidus ULC18]